MFKDETAFLNFGILPSKLTREKEQHYFSQFKKTDSDTLREYLYLSNLRLAIKIAKRYFNNMVEEKDIIMSACKGLSIAIKRYDVDEGHPFSSYAGPWIRQAIKRTIYNDARQIKLPEHIIIPAKNISIASKNFSSKHGRKPTLEELSEESGYSQNEIRYFLKKVSDTQVYRSEELLDVPVEREEIETIEAKQKVKWLLVVLNEKEHDVITSHYGIGKEKQHLEQIAERYNTSKQAITYTELIAKQKLKDWHTMTKFNIITFETFKKKAKQNPSYLKFTQIGVVCPGCGINILYIDKNRISISGEKIGKRVYCKKCAFEDYVG